MRRPTAGARALAVAAAGVAVGVGAGPAAADVTLHISQPVSQFGANVRLTGAVTPAQQTTVGIYRESSGSWHLVAEDQTGADGRYSLGLAARRPGLYVARAGADESDPALLRIRPALTTSFRGYRVLGAPFRLTGRLRPADAGTLRLSVAGRTRTVDVGARGRFSELLPTRRTGRLGLRLALNPQGHFVAVARRFRKHIEAPRLAAGSRSAAVRYLEQRLASLKYVLRDVDRGFHSDTREAVWAFEKVERLGRDGIVDARFWQELARARTPRAAVERGGHIEVDKARQVLFEVRRGKVVRIVHVSTGATGNTPLGRWRIYRKTPGFNSLGMYYSMYFLRGFATHGYHSVPPWPASHGCVRMPNWFAPRFYDRWEIGDVVWVLPTTARRSALWQDPAKVRATSPPTSLGPVGP